MTLFFFVGLAVGCSAERLVIVIVWPLIVVAALYYVSGLTDMVPLTLSEVAHYAFAGIAGGGVGFALESRGRHA